MSENVNISYNLQRYLENPKSREARAFFEGARSMMTALQLTPASEYPVALSTSNQQHIIALLVKNGDRQRDRRRDDAQQMLRLYDVDKMGFLAFVFDLPKINIMGQAVDETGEVLEDAMFRLLPDKTHDGWPDRKIVNHETDQEISRAEYLALSEEDQEEYCYHRYFDLSLHGKPAFRICNSDQYLMEELIRQSILIGDPLINRRFLTEIYSSAETCTVGHLYHYRQAILNAFAEIGENVRDHAITPMVMSQAKQGYIQSIGHLRIAMIYSLYTSTKPLDLLKLDAADLRMLDGIICACAEDDNAELATFITDEDIESYQTPNGDCLPGAEIQYGTDETTITEIPPCEVVVIDQQRDFFKHRLVCQKLAPRLYAMLNRVLTRDDLTITELDPGRLQALTQLSEHLNLYGFDKTNA